MRRKLLKYIKRMLIGIGILIGALLITYFAFVNFSPQFGGKISKEKQEEYTKSENYADTLGSIQVSDAQLDRSY